MELPSGRLKTTRVRNFKKLLRENIRLAGGTALFSSRAIDLLATITKDFGFSFKAGELKVIDDNWYVTHTGLLRLAHREKCWGIHVEAVDSLCDSAASRFVLKATVFPSKDSSGFVGYGDADPSNVSFLVHGAEMRVAETRAVNRALRKAYGIGICSVEEIGSLDGPNRTFRRIEETPTTTGQWESRRSATVRDHLCQLIRQHQLDAKSGQVVRDRLLWCEDLARRHARAGRELSSPTWPTGPRKTAMPYSASSIAISARKKVQHETPDCRPPCRRSLCGRPNP